MPIRLRLARVGLTRNSPHFNVVAIPNTSRTTAKPLEILGHYNPRPRLEPPVSKSPNGQIRDERVWGPRQHAPKTGLERAGHKTVEWNVARVKYWLSQGAQPSETVEKLLVKAQILKSNPVPKPNSAFPVSRERRIRDAVRAMEP